VLHGLASLHVRICQDEGKGNKLSFLSSNRLTRLSQTI